jgi:hypothetical protein
MRKLAALAIFVALASCNKAEPRNLTIKALLPDTAGGNSFALTGEFYTGPAAGGDPSRTSTGTGGACLLAQVQEKVCVHASDCDVQFQTGRYALTTWGGYCLDRRPGTTDAPSVGQCWVKPSEDWCAKSPFEPWPDGTHSVPAIPVDRTQFYRQAKRINPNLRTIAWRVLACLNVYDDQLKRDALACGGEKAPQSALVSAGKSRLIL